MSSSQSVRWAGPREVGRVGGSQPVQCRQDLRPAYEPALQSKLSRIVPDHQADRYREEALTGNEQHQYAGQYEDCTKQILDACDCEIRRGMA